jgi:hypothetical protein
VFPEHEIAGEWRSWQRTCFGSLEGFNAVGSSAPSTAGRAAKAPIIVRFASTERSFPTASMPLQSLGPNARVERTAISRPEEHGRHDRRGLVGPVADSAAATKK